MGFAKRGANSTPNVLTRCNKKAMYAGIWKCLKFKKVIRQSTLGCVERGLMLLRVWNMKHCTMQQLKNWVKSSKLIISLWILTQKFRNFAQTSLNSPKTQIKTNIKKYIWKIRKKSKKPVWGVCSSQDWSQKNPLAKRNQI